MLYLLSCRLYGGIVNATNSNSFNNSFTFFVLCIAVLKLNINLSNYKAIRPKDLRISAISNVNTYGSLTQAATLENHRDTRITREHYTRAAIAFEGKRKTKKTKI